MSAGRCRVLAQLRTSVVAAGLVAAAALATPSGALAAPGGAGHADPPAAPPDRVETVDRTDRRAPAADFARVRSGARAGEEIRVIVGLRTRFTPEGALDAGAVRSQRAEIAEETERVVAALRGAPFDVVHRYDSVPYVALQLSTQALDRLESSGRAASVEPDALDSPTLAQSTPLVESTETEVLGRSGSGRVVAVLDTGVDKGHPFLQRVGGGSKVLSEACFSANANCPGGVTSSTASGSGVPCTYATAGCRHGTHVAGIAAGRSATFDGVAPGANLVSINVFSRFTGQSCAGATEDPCTKAFVSDQIKGLERVNTLTASLGRISAVNMSLGGGIHAANCDTDSRKAIIDTLRSKGIATVIASGNDFSNAGVSAPSCISSAITVGSTTKGDQVSAFSNHHGLVELLAPGSAITSSVPGGGFASFDGTSMATPHVAGAWAILKQTSPGASVATVLSQLQTTGRTVTRNAVPRKRIRVLAASARLVQSGMRLQSTFSGQGTAVTSQGVGLSFAASRGGTGTPAAGSIPLSLPRGSTVQQAFLIWQTLGGPDTTAVLDGVTRTGTLVGASADTCWGFNERDGVRTYRASLGTSVGAGTHTVSGIGNGTTVDPQGASLVIVYTRPFASSTSRVVLRTGAATVAGAGQSLSWSFTGLSVPNGVNGSPALLLGISDGQGGTDGATSMDGTQVVPANAWAGADGRFWDDARFALPTSTLPAGTTSRTVTQPAGSDCLSLAYSALQYENAQVVSP